MLQKIKQFFNSNLIVTDEENSQHQLQLATTALFIEMMLQDDKQHSEEKNAVKNAIKTSLNVSSNEIDELFSLAEEELKNATDYHQFTQLINKNFDKFQKIKIIENLWSIAYSDSQLDDLEEHMVRKIAELIHVPHIQFIKAKLKMQNKPGKSN
ncbi:MAG: TerB family tellurite resistance protein [Pseudomonadota bacterium]